MVQRWKLIVEYDGRPFIGWQRQKHGTSVQHALEEAIFLFSAQRLVVEGAGRTDAGVHAYGQVAHIDLEENWGAKTIRDAVNFHLKDHPIALLSAQRVPSHFHARFSALSRHYRYIILNRPVSSVLKKGHVWHIGRSLDMKAMEEAAQYLIGTHDFSSFRGKYCQAASPVKTMSSIDFSCHGDEIHIDMTAPSFLHHQVRNIVGTLHICGIGRMAPSEIKRILCARSRSKAGITAPAGGLYLCFVEYPDHFSSEKTPILP